MKRLLFAATIVAMASLTGCARLRQCGFLGFAGNAGCLECNDVSDGEVIYESQYIPSESQLNAPELPPLEEVAPPAV